MLGYTFFAGHTEAKEVCHLLLVPATTTTAAAAAVSRPGQSVIAGTCR